MSQLDNAIAQYNTALIALKDNPSQPSLEQILGLLAARDAVQAALNENRSAPKEALSQLVQLDSLLTDLAYKITEDDTLALCRQSLNPPPSAWWWFLETLPPKLKLQPRWAQYDWLWNLGTVACLVISTTFLTQTARAFSGAQGLDLLGMLSTISQGAGVVLVAGGALTQKGQKVVEKALTSLRIPPYLHSEATFVGALATLGVSYLTYSNLPFVGELYYQQGQRQQTEYRWSEAQESYKRALNFIPDDPKISFAIGSIYETLGDFDKAIAEYQKGILVGDPASMNALGKVLLWQAWEKTHWMGKIDEETARDVELLFERASTIADRQPDKKNAQLLQAEIRTNQVILSWATLGWDAGEALLSKTGLLGNAVFLEQEAHSFNPEPALLSRLSRNECYRTLGVMLSFAFDRAPSGVDPRVAYREFEFSCFEIARGARPEDLYDSKIIDSALSIEPVRKLLQELEANITPASINDPKLLAQLQQTLSTQIQQKLNPNNLPKATIILRVSVNKTGQIVRYYAYDAMSRDYAYTTPIESLGQASPQPSLKLQNQTSMLLQSSEPLAEFKVTFSSSGKVEVRPWSAKATAAPEATTDPAEIGILQHYLFEKIDQILSDPLVGVKLSSAEGVFVPSLIYRVSIAPDGNIADYQPLDKRSAENFPDTPLAHLPKSNATDVPLVQFTVEFKASNVFRITPRTE